MIFKTNNYWKGERYEKNNSAVTVYPGMLMESKRATPYAMTTNGVATIKTVFVVKCIWFWMSTTTIEDTSAITLYVPSGSL